MNEGMAILGLIIIGVVIGILIASTASSFAVEITPNNTLRAAIEFA